MTVEEYAGTLLHLSARIVGTVHDEGPEAILKAIDQALIVEAPGGVDPAVALITVLAAQVDVDTTAWARLAWIWQPPVVTVRRHGPAPSSPCGTRSAYNRHRRYGEVPCRACMTASAQYTRDRRRRKAAA